MVPGHPFKGGPDRYSTGQLLHPEAKKFGLVTPHVFLPPRPSATPHSAPAEPAHNFENSESLLTSYFGNNFQVKSGKCETYVNTFKKCFEGNKARDVVETCGYYL